MIFPLTGNLTLCFSVYLLYSIIAKRDTFAKRQMKLQSRASLVHRCFPGQCVFCKKPYVFVKFGKRRHFSWCLFPLKLLLSPHFPLTKCQFGDCTKGMFSCVWRYIYLGSVGHILVFWRKSCLYLIVAICPNVADGFQYIPTAHCAESPGSCDKKKRSRNVVHCAGVRRNMMWMCGTRSWSVENSAGSQTDKL